MSDSYEELSKRATKGDKQALRELFSLGEKLFSEQQFQQAAAVFKDSAISYRILAFRQGARAEDAEKNAASLEIARQIYQAWIEKNPSGLRKTPFPAPRGADLSRIRDIVYENLIHDSTFFRCSSTFQPCCIKVTYNKGYWLCFASCLVLGKPNTITTRNSTRNSRYGSPLIRLPTKWQSDGKPD